MNGKKVNTLSPPVHATSQDGDLTSTSETKNDPISQRQTNLCVALRRRASRLNISWYIPLMRKMRKMRMTVTTIIVAGLVQLQWKKRGNSSAITGVFVCCIVLMMFFFVLFFSCLCYLCRILEIELTMKFVLWGREKELQHQKNIERIATKSCEKWRK